MKRLGLLILLSCMVFLSGCQQENHSEENRTDNNIVETQEDVSAIVPESIVSVQGGQFDYAEGYSTLPSLASDSEENIYGEIVAIDYLVENGHCRTNSEVQIIKSIKGNFSEGEIIRVVEDQGVVSVREYIDSHDSESAQEINRSYFEQYPDVKIPTLREVLELVKPGTMEINIELKTGIFWYPEIERKVLELVKEEGMEDRIIYSSFNHYSVQKIKELSPEAETAYLIGDVMLDVAAYTKNTGIKGLHPALFHVKMADFLKEYKESGIALRVWTVNEKDQIRWLIDEGVDAVITNYPDRGLEARVEAEAESREC